MAYRVADLGALSAGFARSPHLRKGSSARGSARGAGCGILHIIGALSERATTYVNLYLMEHAA